MVEWFAGSNTSFDEANYVIFYFPYDRTATHRHGAELAPKSICWESWNFELWDMKYGLDSSKLKICDSGSLDIGPEDSPITAHNKAYEKARTIIGAGKFPVMIGGEHTGTFASVRAMVESAKDFGVIALDAHLDFREEYQQENLSHACTARRVFEVMGKDRTAWLGVRSACKEELDDASANGFLYRTAWDIKKEGIERTVKEILANLKCRKIYLSLDMDVIDPSIAPGVSTPEPFGLTAEDVERAIEILSPKLVGFDLMEVCPNWEKAVTPCLAAKYLFAVMTLHNSSVKR
jgi:agmatinase